MPEGESASAGTARGEEPRRVFALRALTGQSELPGFDVMITHSPMTAALVPHIPAFFHATKSVNLPSIMREGLRPAGRLGSMHSIFPPWDKWRAVSMQRWKAGDKYDLVLIFNTKRVYDYVQAQGSGIYFNEQGAVMIPATLPCGETLSKVVLWLEEGMIPLFDERFCGYAIGGVFAPKDAPGYPAGLESANFGTGFTSPEPDESGSADFGTGDTSQSGWTGRIWRCELCNGVNLAGNLICLRCASVVGFKNPEGDDLFSPIAALVARVAAKTAGRPEDEITARLSHIDVARQVAHGGRIARRSLWVMIRERVVDTVQWQWKWINLKYPGGPRWGSMGKLDKPHT